jgi:dienelactone hydrolase
MNAYYYILIIVCVVVAVLLAAMIAIPSVIYHKFFSLRQDRSPLLKYFSPQDFNLNYRELPVSYRGKKLYGAVYYTNTLQDCQKLIIFAHGLGPGHCAYMTEIAYYCRQGFAVLAYDNYGCDRSEGDGIRSFYTGAECVIAAYIAAKSDEELKTLPIYLVGHSWGGYSVLCASLKLNVEKVVAFSPFNSETKLLRDFCAKGSKFLSVLIAPMVAIICAFKDKGEKRAAKAIEKSGKKALLIWGEKDGLVTKANSAACAAKGDNIEVLLLPDKMHNPYNTVEAESKLAELTAAFGKKFESQSEQQSFFSNFDYVAATQEDLAVMEKTVVFINE